MKKFMPASRSFSLVEVAVAMAILAVAMVGVLSLLPVALDSARQVHNEAVATLVARTAIGNIWLSNFGRTNFLEFREDQFFDQDGQTNSNKKFDYFRLRITNSATGSNSCRYFLTLQWPAGALRGTTPAVTAQKRTFVTEAVRP